MSLLLSIPYLVLILAVLLSCGMSTFKGDDSFFAKFNLESELVDTWMIRFMWADIAIMVVGFFFPIVLVLRLITKTALIAIGIWWLWDSYKKGFFQQWIDMTKK